MQEMYLFYDPFLYPLNKIYKFITCTLIVMDILLSFLNSFKSSGYEITKW